MWWLIKTVLFPALIGTAFAVLFTLEYIQIYVR